MDTPDSPRRAEMVAEHLCPVCGARATLHCAGCDRVFCAEHVTRSFALGYAFVCDRCMADVQDGATDEAPA